MKRFCVVLALMLFLVGCAEKEPATVATISPGPAVECSVDTPDIL